MSNLHPVFQNIFDSHANAQKVAMELSKPVLPILYKGYSIVEDHDQTPYNKEPQYMFFPTDQGEQHDADCRDGESYSYTGNCKWADSIEEAKDAIMEKLMQEKPAYLVKTYSSKFQSHFNLTKFWWIEDAIQFAKKFNGVPMFPINSI
jgi:hypothetical protein